MKDICLSWNHEALLCLSFSPEEYFCLSQACHNFLVKKPKIFENVKSERAAGNFQKSRTPRVSAIISKNSQI